MRCRSPIGGFSHFKNSKKTSRITLQLVLRSDESEPRQEDRKEPWQIHHGKAKDTVKHIVQYWKIHPFWNASRRTKDTEKVKLFITGMKHGVWRRRTCSKMRGKFFDLANRKAEQLFQVSSPCLDDHQNKKEELESVGKLSEVCASSGNACTWPVVDLTFCGQSTTLPDQSQNGLKLVTDVWPD